MMLPLLPLLRFRLMARDTATVYAAAVAIHAMPYAVYACLRCHAATCCCCRFDVFRLFAFFMLLMPLFDDYAIISRHCWRIAELRTYAPDVALFCCSPRVCLMPLYF